MVGWLVGCGPRKEVKVSYLIYSYFLSNSNFNSKFEFEFTQLNPNKIQIKIQFLTLTFTSPIIYGLRQLQA
jgi:hypothetical protein